MNLKQLGFKKAFTKSIIRLHPCQFKMSAKNTILAFKKRGLLLISKEGDNKSMQIDSYFSVACIGNNQLMNES